jgi:hypothetical protein
MPNDRPGTLKALEDMIRYYPDKKYWEDLLNAHLFMQNSERDLRALFRLMQDTDTMDKPDEFAEAASVMVAGGFPTEAQHTIEEGMAANVFQGESKQRAQEEFDRAKSGAVADKKELPGADAALLQLAIRALPERAPGSGGGVEFASASELRAISLRIFDRSFAVTYWLQAVAIAIGLFGIAASFSAQVLARRKEFGLLAHLGLTRRQVLAVVAIEGAVWTAAGALLGLLLGLAVSVVLVKVVNPQSFHWTMDLMVPWLRLAALCAAVLAAGTLTAWLAGRAAAGRDAVLAVKEDW